MQIVAYVPDAQYAQRDAVADAVGLRKDGQPFKVVFRDPMKFESPDADVLDTIVYVADGRDAAYESSEYHGASYMAQEIRKAYAAFPGTRVLSLDASPMPGLPMEVVPRELRPVRPAVTETPLVDGVPLLGQPDAAVVPDPPVESIGVVKRRAADLEAKRLAVEAQGMPQPGLIVP